MYYRYICIDCYVPQHSVTTHVLWSKCFPVRPSSQLPRAPSAQTLLQLQLYRRQSTLRSLQEGYSALRQQVFAVPVEFTYPSLHPEEVYGNPDHYKEDIVELNKGKMALWHNTDRRLTM
jgi:hypothetical protein